MVAMLAGAALAASAATAQPPDFAPPAINDSAALARLEKNSGVTLQWIGDQPRGELAVTRQPDGRILIKGGQTSPDGADTLVIDGELTGITARTFSFRGTIVMDTGVMRSDGTAPCTRSGDFQFRITGQRKYWRLREHTGYCGGLTDYVDIFF
jgi:hypothetical protein